MPDKGAVDSSRLLAERRFPNNIRDRVSVPPYTHFSMIQKTNYLIRAIDVVLATALILFFLPVFILLPFFMKIACPGRILFIQERLGQGKKLFKMIKFRTMVEGADKKGPVWAECNDNRITGLGRFMRKTRLDELPQLFNVLSGDMSLVGPRPVVHSSAEKLSAIHPDYDKRFIVKPGITGWAQIYWRHSPLPEKQIEKLRFDLAYTEGLSLRDYFKILLSTVMTVLRGKGI